MLSLEDIRPNEGATHAKKRKGRGIASGHGKTACRGNNGEGQRSGNSHKRGFEGGQMPSYRQMPKLKGFKNRFREESAVINVARLAAIDADVIDLAYLQQNKKASSTAVALRILGNGEISKAITVKATYFSPSAKEKIEKAGGKAELV
ncbi:MAG: 50S ribosomal protein L15 [Candidatus Gastranaerophilales bacterium]|jgi:large subunit ribosomal protein L15|nr:50S ribosomal protein L15 [Candidatus Gastranaerophilales bacterium]